MYDHVLINAYDFKDTNNPGCPHFPKRAGCGIINCYHKSCDDCYPDHVVQHIFDKEIRYRNIDYLYDLKVVHRAKQAREFLDGPTGKVKSFESQYRKLARGVAAHPTRPNKKNVSKTRSASKAGKNKNT